MFSGASISAWYDFIVDPIVNLFTTLVNSLASIVITPIAGILYTLQIGFFLLMDCIQSIFRRIAGLETYYYAGEAQEGGGDPVLDFIMDPTVLGVFFSVLIVAIILLFVTTFVFGHHSDEYAASPNSSPDWPYRKACPKHKTDCGQICRASGCSHINFPFCHRQHESPPSA